MNRKLALMLALSVILACALGPVTACTIFNAQGNGMLLAGNNEEHEDPNGEVRFEPASGGKYGRVTFAFGPFTQGGMNEQGLFFDFWAPNAFRLPPWQPGQLLPDGRIPAGQPSMDEMWEIGIGRDYIFPRLSSGNFEVSVESFRDLLMNTSMDATAYSNIYDLRQGAVYVYNQRDFDHPVRFDLKAELAEGSHSFFLKDLLAGPGQ